MSKLEVNPPLDTMLSPRPAAVAPEVVLRLLHRMDEDLDEFITVADVKRFVAKHNLPFSEMEVTAMFEEANSSADGLIDAEQLGKAVSHKFPNRRYNAAWERFFSLSPPLATGERLTAFTVPPVEQEPIRANFEQEPDIITFEPLTNPGGTASGTGRGLPAFAATASSVASFSTLQTRRSTMTSAPFNSAPRPLYTGARLGSEAERTHEEVMNRYMQADPLRPPAEPPSAPESTAQVQIASFDADAPAPRCGFAAQTAFARSVEEASRTSAGVGWKTKLPADYAAAKAAGPPSPLHYGLHEKEWFFTPTAGRDYIPTRVDGKVTRVTGEKATVPLRLMITESSLTSLANSQAHKRADEGAPPKVPFYSRFSRSSEFGSQPALPKKEHLKMVEALDRLERARGTEYPPPIAYMNGKPTAYKFRPEEPDPAKVPDGAPPFITSTLGRAWPKFHQIGEGLGPSLLLQANPPNPITNPALRLQYTENVQPSARTGRSGLVADAR